MSTATQLPKVRSQHYLRQRPSVAPKTTLRDLWTDGLALVAILALFWILSYEFVSQVMR